MEECEGRNGFSAVCLGEFPAVFLVPGYLIVMDITPTLLAGNFNPVT